MEFVTDNIVWFIAGGLILLMTIVGYYAEKTDFGKNSNSDNPKKEKKKKEKKSKNNKKETHESIDNNSLIIENKNSIGNIETKDTTINEVVSEIDSIEDSSKNHINNVSEVIENVSNEIIDMPLVDSPDVIKNDEIKDISDNNGSNELINDSLVPDSTISFDENLINGEENLDSQSDLIIDSDNIKNNDLERNETISEIINDENDGFLEEKSINDSITEEVVKDEDTILQELENQSILENKEEITDSKIFEENEKFVEEAKISEELIDESEINLKKEDNNEKIEMNNEVYNDLEMENFISNIKPVIDSKEVEIPPVTDELDENQNDDEIINIDKNIELSAIEKLNRSVEQAALEELNKEQAVLETQIIENDSNEMIVVEDSNKEQEKSIDEKELEFAFPITDEQYNNAKEEIKSEVILDDDTDMKIVIDGKIENENPNYEASETKENNHLKLEVEGYEIKEKTNNSKESLVEKENVSEKIADKQDGDNTLAQKPLFEDLINENDTLEKVQEPIENSIKPVIEEINDLPNELIFKDPDKEEKEEQKNDLVEEIGISEVTLEELPVIKEEEVVMTGENKSPIPEITNIDPLPEAKEEQLGKKKKEKKPKKEKKERKKLFSFGKKKVATENMLPNEMKIEDVFPIEGEIKTEEKKEEIPKIETQKENRIEETSIKKTNIEEISQQSNHKDDSDDEEEIWKF